MSINYPDLARTALETYQEQLEAIRADDHLSAEGKAAKITDLHDQVSEKVDRYREKYVAGRRKRRDSLQRELFGQVNDSTVMSYRDAQDRAAKLTAAAFSHPEQALREAQTMLRQAEISGDTLLGKAIAAAAYAEHWDAVLDTYVADNPELADKFNELIQLDTDLSNIFGDWENMSVFDMVAPREHTGVKPGAAIAY